MPGRVFMQAHIAYEIVLVKCTHFESCLSSRDLDEEERSTPKLYDGFKFLHLLIPDTRTCPSHERVNSPPGAMQEIYWRAIAAWELSCTPGHRRGNWIQKRLINGTTASADLGCGCLREAL
ncbi:hypothetical protein AURDEDRAFT_173902 [Auricularia subglabra TFB-10046 SS5]|nr:hypothetical protein AURDEDRAFT_173902 [Auricularia subglabra TFB-10046 SS5]